MAAQAENEADAADVSPWRRAVEWLDWKINPVLLRDLRLYTRGKLTLISYFLILLALVLIAVLYAYIAGRENEDGRMLLRILVNLLAAICGAMIPNLVFERFRAELSNRATELALMSTLTPARLVRGKLLAAWCVSLVVLSIASPMLATAYLLGGVNILSLLGPVAGVAVAAAVMPTPQLFMASQRHGKSLSQGLSALVFLVQIILMGIYANALLETFIGSPYAREFNYVASGLSIIVGVLIGQFLYFATVGRLEGEAADRDAAPRKSLAAAAYIGGGAIAALVYETGGTLHGKSGVEIIYLMGATACFVATAFCIGFLIITHSSPVPARGVAAKWRNRPLRGLFLMPGMKSLTAFFLLNAVVIPGIALIGVAGPDADADNWRILCFCLAPFQAVAYGMVVYFYLVVRVVKNKRNPNLLPTTILLTNVTLLIAAIFVIVIVGYSTGESDFYAAILGCAPAGLFVAGSGSRLLATTAGAGGLMVTGLAMAALLPALTADMRKILGMIPENGDAPE